MTRGKQRIVSAVLIMAAVAVRAFEEDFAAAKHQNQRQQHQQQHRQMMEQSIGNGIRHNVQYAPAEIDVHVENTFDEKFMELMKSPCRPEVDGYFGATFGTPIRIQYGFKIETLPLAPITKVMSAIEDFVVDEILSQEFPLMCGFRRDRDRGRQLGHANGFLFVPYEEVPESCTSAQNPINFCGVFRGMVQVFGENQEDAALEVLKIIDQVLDAADPGRMHQDIVTLVTVEELELVISGTGGKIDHGTIGDDWTLGLPTIGLVGLGLAIVVVACGLVWLFLDRQRRFNLMHYDFYSKPQNPNMAHHPPHRTKKTSRRNSNNGGSLLDAIWRVLPHGREKGRVVDYDPQANSLRHSPETAEAVDFGAGNMLLLTDGRPVEIEFDRSYSTNMAPASEGVV